MLTKTKFATKMQSMSIYIFKGRKKTIDALRYLNTSRRQPIFSFANGEMGLMSNYIIRTPKNSLAPRIRKLYFEYVNDDLPPRNFWSDALEG